MPKASATQSHPVRLLSKVAKAPRKGEVLVGRALLEGQVLDGHHLVLYSVARGALDGQPHLSLTVRRGKKTHIEVIDISQALEAWVSTAVARMVAR
jgi:hypothetical protein